MAGLGDVLVLLHDADTNWATVQGDVREWRDQGLVSRAFREEVAWGGGEVVTVESTGPQEDIAESRHRLWTDGDRTRVERSPTAEARPELLVRVGGVWWWYKRDKGSVTNGGDPNVDTGGDEIRAHLHPSVFISRFRWSVLREETVAGRPCIVVRADARPLTDRRPLFPPAFDMIAGGTTFEIAIDAERGVLLSVTKLVDDLPAEIREFLDIGFDGALNDELFDFRSPDGSPVQSFDAYRRGLQRDD